MTEPTTWYAATAVASPERPTLSHDLDADVCVIGAAVTAHLSRKRLDLGRGRLKGATSAVELGPAVNLGHLAGMGRQLVPSATMRASGGAERTAGRRLRSAIRIETT